MCKDSHVGVWSYYERTNRNIVRTGYSEGKIGSEECHVTSVRIPGVPVEVRIYDKMSKADTVVMMVVWKKEVRGGIEDIIRLCRVAVVSGALGNGTLTK